MKKTNLILTFLLLILFAWSCGSSSSNKKNASEEKMSSEESSMTSESSSSIEGSYTLTDMMVVESNLTPTPQDLEYINQSKERAVEKTVLTLNKDGSFERVFPHPSGDGNTKTHAGQYEISEDKLVLNVEMKGKTHPMEFTILSQSSDKLSLVTSFGKLQMNYIYSK